MPNSSSNTTSLHNGGMVPPGMPTIGSTFSSGYLVNVGVQRQRGFEPVEYFTKDGQRSFNFSAKLPTRATKKSAGYDFYALENVSIKEGEIKLVPTGVKAYMQPWEMLVLANRSSNPKKGLLLANGIGIVDADYYNNPDNDGHIFFAFLAGKDVEIKAGDKIGQGVFANYLIADNDGATGARKGGFGSTDGKKD